MVADAEYVNDDEYFSDFGELAEDYNKDKVQSVFSLSKNWGKYSLVGLLKYTKDLEVDDPETLQLLPRIAFDVNRKRFAESPFYYSLSSEYTHFWRREGLRGERLMIRPLLAASWSPGNLINIAPEVAWRERVYWGLSDDSAGDNQGLPEFKTRVNTRFQRVFHDGFGAIGKLRHVLEPEVVYLYVPDEEQDHLPEFDIYDRIEQANRFEYALVQRLTARFDRDDGQPRYRELVYLRLSQSYDLTDDAEDQRFGEIRAEMTLLPLSWMMLRTDTTYDADTNVWNRISAETALQDDRGNAAGVEYRYDRTEDIEYAEVDLSVAMLKPVYLHYQERYDLVEQEQLEQVVRVEYRRQCWSADLSYRDHEDDRSIMLTFTMRGIGTVGGVGGSLGGI